MAGLMSQLRSAIAAMPVALTLLFATNAKAADLPYGPLDEELFMLPDWCRAKTGQKEIKNRPLQDLWQQRLGYENWLNLHHFCHPLLHYIRVTRGVYNADHMNAIAELGYAIRAMNSTAANELSHDIPVRAQILNYIGSALWFQVKFTKQGTPDEGIAAFKAAIEFQPSFVPPYLALADFYADGGKKQEAIEILASGLKESPGNPSLRRRMTKLGGALPPMPAASAVEPSASGIETSGS